MAKEFNPSRSELKQLLRTLNRGWKALKAEDLTPETTCPDSWTLASYVTGELDDKEARRTINSHLAFCDSCFKDYAALVGPEKIAAMFSEAGKKFSVKNAASKNITVDDLNARWRRIRDEKMKCIIDLGRIYGANTHMGPIRIAAEKPTFSAGEWKTALNDLGTRILGTEWCDGELSKEIEVPMGKNAYRVKLRASSKEVVCDISGLRTPVQMPLRILLWETRDEKTLYSVTSWQTDNFGNAHIPFAATIGTLLALNLVLKDKEQSIGFRIPKDVFYAPVRNLFAKIIEVSSREKIVEHLEQMKVGANSLLPLLEELFPEPMGKASSHATENKAKDAPLSD
jgi:hypothetical protein